MVYLGPIGARSRADDRFMARYFDDASPADRIQSVSLSRVSRRSPPDHIKDLQRALIAAGFDPGKVDGRMGPRTKRAIRAFQKANGLTVDGIAGRRTLGKLNSGTAEGPARVPRARPSFSVSDQPGRWAAFLWTPQLRLRPKWCGRLQIQTFPRRLSRARLIRRREATPKVRRLHRASFSRWTSCLGAADFRAFVFDTLRRGLVGELVGRLHDDVGGAGDQIERLQQAVDRGF